uniref:SHSP domain-containing protein n=1 Tax=Parascaris equorum TaxID=6256 RepID=A0A914R2D1_PAREQ
MPKIWEFDQTMAHWTRICLCAISGVSISAWIFQRIQGLFKMETDKSHFTVELNVSQFHPDELSVNVVGKGLVVEGHHQEREDNGGFVERHFVRKYFLPKNAKPEELISKLSEDGVLSVTVPKVETVENVRNIPIEVRYLGNVILKIDMLNSIVTIHDN